VQLCIPLGGYLMCLRFLQVAERLVATAEWSHHGATWVEGIEPVDAAPAAGSVP
jgi:C4-dicarboxylate transporter, DctQ subunit